jgi:DNA-directed RNA polymerase specialized sigma24 family protein
MAASGDLAPSLTGAFLLLRSDRNEPKPAPQPSAPVDCVRQAASGDVRAFEQLYELHLPRVHSLVRRMTGGRDTDELTQDIFVRVWQKLGSFRGDSAFGTWLHRLAVNVVIERFRTVVIAAGQARRLARLRSGAGEAARRRPRDFRAARRRRLQAL